MNTHMQEDWFCYARECCAEDQATMPLLGGPGNSMQADEPLFREKRKGNMGRMLGGEPVWFPPK